MSRWDDSLADLAAWHAARDRQAAERAMRIVEPFLWGRIPARARMRWSKPDLEDAVRGFLQRLLTRPLPSAASEDPAAYISQSFRNWCIDLQRGRDRRPEEAWESDDGRTTASSDARPRLARVVEALEQLPIQDRVVIKVEDLPWALSDDELRWLAGRGGVSVDAVRAQLESARTTYDTSLVFDPGDSATAPKGRRDRMERFRRRRSRARQRLRERLGGAA